MASPDNNWITSGEFELMCEHDPLNYLRSIGINATKVKREEYPTPDYQWNDVGIEVTAVHLYNPPRHQSDTEILANDPGNMYVIYAYSNENTTEPIWKTITKRRIDAPYSLIYTRQNVSVYRKKIINEIDKKYIQARDYDKEVVVLDFRTAPFRHVTLRKEIQNILGIVGETHLNLTGIIIGTKAHDTASIDKLRYSYVKNNRSCYTVKELPEESDLEESGSTDLIDSIEIVAQQGVLSRTRILIETSLLLESAEELEKEIRRQRLPV
jgi:hypothetical protein